MHVEEIGGIRIEDVVKSLECFTTYNKPCAKCKFNPDPGRNWPNGCVKGQMDVIEAAQKTLLALTES